MDLVQLPITEFPGYENFIKVKDYLPQLNLTDGPWIAGGSLLRLAKGIPFWNDIKEEESGYDSDIDIFFRTNEQCLKSISMYKNMRDKGKGKGYETDNAYSFSFKMEKDRKRFIIQSIKKFFSDDIESLLGTFDFTVAQMVTDLETVVMPSYVIDDIVNNSLKLSTGKYNSENFLKRVFKYSANGFNPEPGLLVDLANMDKKALLNILSISLENTYEF